MAYSSLFILTIDDDPSFGDLIGCYVAEWGYGHLHVISEDDLRSRDEIGVPAAVLLDLHLGEQNGLDLLPGLRHRWPDTPVFIATTGASVPSAVQAMRLGAYDYLVKPLDIGRLEIALRNAVDHWLAVKRLRELEAASTDSPFADLIGSSEGLRRVFRTIKVAAPTNVPMLLLGETGTGKELAARAIHRFSDRCEGPFVPVNCAAMPATLIESTLFGSERGAFTGAHDTRDGYCQQADGGTLFFDEIGELAVEAQPKLLRFLQDHVVMPVGSSIGRKVDVRVVAATNRDPAKAIAAGHLREDLFYRLNVVSCTLPPLRERRADIAQLIYHFLSSAARQYHRPMTRVSPAAMTLLQDRLWPGNVRELENFIVGVVVRNADVEVLEPHMLDPAVNVDMVANSAGGSFESSMMFETLEEMEKRMLVEALQKTQGDVTGVADRLGISPATVYRKMKKYGIPTAQNAVPHPQA